MAKLKTFPFLIIIAGIFCFGVFSFVLASSTDGVIDSTYKYAWSENTGWINFGISNGNIHITDSGFSGYALGENIGWIYLGDIINSGEGVLSGYAWSENAGWIKFNPTNGGVVINSSGEFTGSALGENIGWIIFDCATSACVKTDWRPQSARVCTSWTYSDWSSCSNSQQSRTVVSSSPSGCSGGSPSLTQNCSSPAAGGGGLPAGAYNVPSAPQGGFKVIINDNQGTASDRKVKLTLAAGPDAVRMVLSGGPSFQTSTGQISYQSSYEWDLCQNKTECSDGTYFVYAKFFTQYGVSSEAVSATVVLETKKTIIEQIIEIPGKIKEIFVPPATPTPTPIPIEQLTSKEAPVALQGKWQLLPSEPIREFVLAPLPKEIAELAQKFPELGQTFEKVGISKITDLEKINAVKLTLPGLTESAELSKTEISAGKFALPVGIPIAKLSLESKQKLPVDIVFAKAGGGLVDFNAVLSISRKGEPEQKIRTVVDSPLQLAIKPEKPVSSIKGYFVFKSKNKEILGMEEQSISLSSLLGAAVFPVPDLAQTVKLSNNIAVEGAGIAEAEKGAKEGLETRLVLFEFDYQDFDQDGIYTADIRTPVVDGEYEIITVINYKDIKIGPKETRLITVIDPEGYVFEKSGNKETRIPGAVVSLFWLNPETKQYELWPAKDYQQENPQVTDATGKYSFLVAEGYYYLKIEAPGYVAYDGKSFQVKEGSGVHFNVEIKARYWWLRVVDWKSAIFIIVILLLLYNFYRDKIRERSSRKTAK